MTFMWVKIFLTYMVSRVYRIVTVSALKDSRGQSETLLQLKISKLFLARKICT